ncbi:hypothetical protein [Streptomyces paludis]|uniref:Uncharacterized protein n=1 Tax=Streptomyces paludis TaxID=2282738 RepID=A0A345HPK5_9ACTN|nr:hypothetical protein [Streptomyces paludis]AXG78629.1 hypothetical protein DVK44_13945 [Streptomyces paludis]
MKTGHPRDVDPSITGQPHQATGEVPDLMGEFTRTLGNPVDMQRRRQYGVAATLSAPAPLTPSLSASAPAQAAPR